MPNTCKMMDLSLVMLEIGENSLNAGATCLDYCIQVASATGKLTLQLQDNGSGVSEDNLSKLFEAGFSTKGSMGQGLFLIKEQAEESGGKAEIQNDPLGCHVQVSYYLFQKNCPTLGNVFATCMALQRMQVQQLRLTYQMDDNRQTLDLDHLDELQLNNAEQNIFGGKFDEIFAGVRSN